MSKIITMRSQTRKGAAAKIISPNLVPGGAEPFITKSSIGNRGKIFGGVKPINNLDGLWIIMTDQVPNPFSTVSQENECLC